jgi:cell division protein FtsI (penicillin-binding protein 3)
VRLVVVLVLLLIAARLIDIQVVNSGRYSREARSELAQPVTVQALRGGIFARNGQPLAVSIPTKEVIADDFQIRHPITEAKALSPLLKIPASNLATELSRRSGYVPLSHYLGVPAANKVAADHLPGITLVDSSLREYPNGNLASPVIGSVNAAGHGSSGLEYEYNSLLAGKPGRESILESPFGVPLPQTPVVARSVAHPGTGLELTLDPPLQYEAEQALAAQMVSTKARNGIAVVMDVHTGNILAMANLVANPQNQASASNSAPLGSAPTPGAGSTGGAVVIGPNGPVSQAPSALAVTQVNEPGSVFKIATFSAALQDGVITPNTTFVVPDQEVLDGSLFHDAETHPTQPMTATQIIAQSSNIGTSYVATNLGESRLLAQVKTLGFGSPTGLGLPGESPGILATAAQWEPTNIVSLPIGQVDAVTAQQVLDAYNMVANGGVFVPPRLVQATITPSGKAVGTPMKPTRRILSPGIDQEFTKMLEQVVKSGTGVHAVIPGYLVAGKTGTANIHLKGRAGFIPGAFVAEFVGFAPANHPVLSAIVVLNRPNTIYGGSASAPVFAKIMGYALHRYDIPTSAGSSAQGG